MAGGSAISFRMRMAMILFVSTSFMVQYSNWIMGSYVYYGLLLCGAVALLVWEYDLIHIKPSLDAKSISAFVTKFDWLSLCWIPAVVYIGLSCFVGGLKVKEIIDVFTYFVCVVIVLLSGDDHRLFTPAFRVIRIFAIYYAVSVWIQMLCPSVYSVYLNFLPEEVQSNILELQEEQSSYVGFSTNTGFTAGHIVAGILVIYARLSYRRITYVNLELVTLGFLFFTLLLTGKRMHLIAAVAVVCLLFITAVRGKIRLDRMKLLTQCAVIGACVLLFALIFFRFIPVVNRLAETIVGMFTGKDITSGRAKLYAYAIELFSENPIFGIGWSRYPDVMVGVVTKKTAMDTHNIYLQMLSEIGITGFMLMIVPMALTLLATIVQLFFLHPDKKPGPERLSALLFSLAYQVFFLIYGITGNPLFDYNYVILYFLACAVCICDRRRTLADAKRKEK